MSTENRETAVHWVIQANRGAALDVEAMAETLRADGHVAHLLTLEKGAPAPEIPDLPDAAPIVCHGPGFLTRAYGHPRLGAGLFFDRDAFRWSTFRAFWGEAMLATDADVTTLEAAQKRLADGASAFIRPDADSKAFDGGVYDAEGL
ncbi:hypothetical protein [Caulobacter sp. 17J65-9]|uniref:hypothetical protein n=1 Tax=Caulobacter sp. 17J65-9 TaxID=2709382 RepID=UPI0013C5941A|nr:hypothetical protein [Caulobacter sp. 17J65-9]NEX94858.1 hypothetical protein [Caulobacter sp. 17J65-9]